MRNLVRFVSLAAVVVLGGLGVVLLLGDTRGRASPEESMPGASGQLPETRSESLLLDPGATERTDLVAASTAEPPTDADQVPEPRYLFDPEKTGRWMVRDPDTYWYRNEALLAKVRADIPAELEKWQSRRGGEQPSELSRRDAAFLRTLDPDLSGGLSAEDLLSLSQAESEPILDLLERGTRCERDLPDLDALPPIDRQVWESRIADDPLLHSGQTALKHLAASPPTVGWPGDLLQEIQTIRRDSLLAFGPVSREIEGTRQAMRVAMGKHGVREHLSYRDCLAVWPPFEDLHARKRALEEHYWMRIRLALETRGIWVE